MTVCFRMFLPFVRATMRNSNKIPPKGVQTEWKKKKKWKTSKRSQQTLKTSLASHIPLLCSFFVVRIYKMKLIYVETWHEEAPLHTNLIFLMDSHDFMCMREREIIYSFILVYPPDLSILELCKDFFLPLQKFSKRHFFDAADNFHLLLIIYKLKPIQLNGHLLGRWSIVCLIIVNIFIMLPFYRRGRIGRL